MISNTSQQNSATMKKDYIGGRKFAEVRMSIRLFEKFSKNSPAFQPSKELYEISLKRQQLEALWVK